MQANPILQVRVARKCAEAQDICSLELVPLDGESLPAFTALLQSVPWAGRVHLHVDGEGALDMAQLLGAPQAGLHLYVCGPRGFMDAALGHARASGWSEDRLHCEFFAGEAVQREGDAGFEIEVASTGQVVRVAPGQTVVQALAGIGVEVQTSCEQGVCGTCLTRVLAGEPEHRDMYLTEDEQAACDQFLPCCSRAKSARLVLDL
jgi:vanillate O-demethylase ferredoxin subunit